MNDDKDYPIEPGIYAFGIGPFVIDQDAKTITMNPGIYTVRVPIVLPYNDSTVIDGVEYAPLDERAIVEGTRYVVKT